MTLPIILIGLSIICFYFLKTNGYYHKGYFRLQFGSKALLILFYICYLGVVICSFGTRGSEAYAFMKWPLIGSILFGIPFLLTNQGKSYADRFFSGMPVLLAALIHYSMYVIPVILSAFGGNSNIRPANPSASAADSYDYDSDFQQQGKQYQQAQEQERMEQDERNAADMGFNSADDAKHAGMM